MRFYFDTLNGGRSRDDTGQELATLDHAEDEAADSDEVARV
jgi:hypothetical protein